ncbi:MAG: rhomboid family intramembrane serine protease [Pseudomonadota bacterium]
MRSNMLVPWIFRDNVEDSMGHVRCLTLYIVCGIAAARLVIGAKPSSLRQFPMSANNPKRTLAKTLVPA